MTPTTAQSNSPRDHTQSGHNGAKYLTLPSESLYWSLVDAPGLPGDPSGSIRAATATLVSLMEPDLPAENVDVHVVAVRVNPTQVLLCAAERHVLANTPPHVLTLTPERLPEFVTELGTIDPSSLNLLVGEFEPAPLRDQKQRRRSTVLAAVAILSLLSCLGLWRRALHAHTIARASDASVAAMLKAVDATASSPAIAFMHAKDELANLRKARPANLNQPLETPDAAQALAALLATWPGQRSARADLISITPTNTSVNLSLTSNPTEFLDAFHPPAGWQLDEPRLTTNHDVTQLSLVLHRAKGVK